MLPEPLSFSLPLGIAIALAALLSHVFVRIVIRRAADWGLQDLPNERSSHRTPTPRGGGIGIVLAFAVVGPLALPAGLTAGGAVWLVGAAALFLALIGLADDVRGLGLAIRLFAQAAAVAALALALSTAAMPPESDLGLLAALTGGTTAERWLSGHLPPGIAAALDVGVAAALFLGGIWWINLFNFMDGVDGIAATQALFMLLAGAALDGFSASAPADRLGLVLAAAVAGFLLLNWSPARVFMGDAGSLFLGFGILAMAAHDVTSGNTTGWTWLILGATFLTDATVTLVRRASTGQNVTGAHRSHAYQRLCRRWGGHSRVTLVYCLVNVGWLLPLALLAQRKPGWAPWLLGIGCLPLVVVAWRLGAGLKDT